MKLRIVALVLITLTSASIAFSQSPKDKATVYVYSLSVGVIGNLHKSLFVDDRNVAEVKPRRYFILQLDPGKHTLRFKDKTWGGIEKDFAAGETYYLRVAWREGGWAQKPDGIVVETADAGTFAIKNLKPLDDGSIKDKGIVTTKLQ